MCPGDMAPMEDGNRLLFTNKDKCEAIGSFFQEKLSAPAVNGLKNKSVVTTEAAKDPDSCPLPPFRERITEEVPKVTVGEIKMAIANMNLRKAPGPDMMTVLLYRKMTKLHPYLASIFYLILREGKIPRSLCMLYIVPLVKPGGDPTKCTSRRPISLLNTAIKLMEVVVYNRLINNVEHKLDSRQYAYRRDRGTQHHLVELMDYVSRSLVQKK